LAVLAARAERAHAARRRAAVRPADRLAPPAPLWERDPPPRVARDEHRPRPPWARLRGRAGRAGGLARARARGAAAAPHPGRGPRLLLPARHLGDARRARSLPATRRAGRVGEGRGDAVRRAFDLAVAFTALALASPFLALAALAIKLGDPGPVLYRQRRVGF